MKVLLLGASFSTGNRGVGALTVSALKCLFHSSPDAEAVIIDYGRGDETVSLRLSDRERLIRIVKLRFSKKIYLRNNIAMLLLLAALARLLPQNIAARIIGSNRWLKEIASADMAASVAGGDSFSDIYGLSRFFYVALPQLLLLLMRKPLMQLPQTIGPFNNSASKSLAKLILERSINIYTRDYESLNFIKKLLGLERPEASHYFCYDMAFVLDAVKPDGNLTKRTDGLRTVGLNISGLLYIGGYCGNNDFSLRCDYKSLINEIIDYLINVKRVRVLIIPHVYGTSEESDYKASREVYGRLKVEYGEMLAIVEGEHDQSEIKWIIGETSFFIGSRMHACIAAISQGIPAVPIAYSRKFYGVFESVGLEEQVADPRWLDNNAILRVIEKAMSDSERISDELKRRMPGVRKSVLNIFTKRANEDGQKAKDSLRTEPA